MPATLHTELPVRAAYDYQEFASLFGHDRAWTYRLVKAGKLKPITGFGKAMIPASEVDRITKGGSAEGRGQ